MLDKNFLRDLRYSGWNVLDKKSLDKHNALRYGDVVLRTGNNIYYLKV